MLLLLSLLLKPQGSALTIALMIPFSHCLTVKQQLVLGFEEKKRA